jgi:hypothetical protein
VRASVILIATAVAETTYSATFGSAPFPDTADQILDSIARYCNRINESRH